MKGQYFSFDAIIASVIFVMALVALLSYWHSVKAYLDYQNDDLSREAIRISNLLFTPPSPGPSCDSMTRFGLSKSWDDRRLDSSVLACAEGKDTAWLQEMLGTSYKVRMDITKLTDHPSTISIGDPMPPAPAENLDIVQITRAATIYNKTSGERVPASIELVLYREK